MKKLICAKEVEELIAQGKKVMYLEKGTIITPSAKDAAMLNGVEFCYDAPASVTPAVGATPSCGEGIDTEIIYSAFKTLMDQGLLQGLLNSLVGTPAKPFTEEKHESGLKVVRGKTVQMDVFDTGTPGAKAYFQELVNKEESKMSAGFLVIENSRFEWDVTYEEIDYVIEGTLTVEIDGKTYTAHAGDVLFVPKGSKVIWGSPDKARVFFSTYPANWADLV